MLGRLYRTLYRAAGDLLIRRSNVLRYSLSALRGKYLNEFVRQRSYKRGNSLNILAGVSALYLCSTNGIITYYNYELILIHFQITIETFC